MNPVSREYRPGFQSLLRIRNSTFAILPFSLIDMKRPEPRHLKSRS